MMMWRPHHHCGLFLMILNYFNYSPPTDLAVCTSLQCFPTSLLCPNCDHFYLFVMVRHGQTDTTQRLLHALRWPLAHVGRALPAHRYCCYHHHHCMHGHSRHSGHSNHCERGSNGGHGGRGGFAGAGYDWARAGVGVSGTAGRRG